jgi:hypothetical protein
VRRLQPQGAINCLIDGDRCELSTSTCRSRNATPARLQLLGAPGAPLVCAASGASRPQRAEHVTVPLARRDPPPACQGLRRDVRRACHSCVPLPARRDRSEPSTSPCQSRGATDPRLPLLAAGCAPGAPLVCAASGVSRSQRAEHVHVPLARRDRSTPATVAARCAPDTPLVCATSGASRPQRAEHVPVPITRRDRSPPTMACGGMCARRATCVCRSQRVAIATSRARPRAARAS